MSTEGSDDSLEAPQYRFDEFVLDVADRQLWRGDTRIDLNARYFDALVLLVRERGRLVEKDRFFEEVWSDVVVSDSALTQCIKEIRKQLDDDASNPRYIQTVPGHGYRFVGTVEPIGSASPGSDSPQRKNSAETTQVRTVVDLHSEEGRQIWRDHLYELGAGTLGGGIAGMLGGMLYGYGLASAEAGVGTLSTLLVLVSLSALLGLTGGFGVSLGLAGGGIAARSWPKLHVLLRVGGAAFGGLLVGSLAKLLGMDAFNLLFGRAPAGITGGPEGATLGAALALGAHLGPRLGECSEDTTCWHSVVGAGSAGAVAGALIPLAGGHLMGGSLHLLAQSFAESRLQLDRFGSLFGELHFGQATQVALSGIEGLLFCSCVVGAIVLLRHLENRRPDVDEP